MSQFLEMSIEDWEKTYKPITNHLDENASFQNENDDGIMFETYGDEVEFVKKQNPNCIWTYVDGDSNASYIISGWHFVNRLGYFITEVPCPEDMTIEICLDEPNYMCENCEEKHYENVDFMYEYWGDLEKCPKCGTVEEIQEAERMTHANI